MFKLVAEAYECLSNPKKRSLYDRHGHDGVKQGGGGFPHGAGVHSFHDAEEIFRQFFGGRDPFADFFGGSFGSGLGGGGARGAVGRQARDPFAEMMGGGFGGGTTCFSSSSFGGGGGSRSTSTSTTVENGVRVTRRETSIRRADGSSSCTVEEERVHPNGQTERRTLTAPEASRRGGGARGGQLGFGGFGGVGGVGGF